jgi:hypothetical protein
MGDLHMPFIWDLGSNIIANVVAGWVGDVIGIGVALAILAMWIASWHRRQRREGKPGVQAQHFLLIGIAGTWLFLTVSLGTAAWMIWNNQGFTIGTSGVGVGAKKDEGPLEWVYSFSLEGGFGRNIFALRFRGANTSKTPVQIKEANIISLIDGTLLPLEIVGVDPKTDENKTVSIDKVQLITPGAPVQLVAKFGPPDPANPGKILGLDSKTFLEKWRQFSFNVKDDTRSYRFDFNENSMMPFFQGQVGPRVMIKPSE